MNKIYNVIWSKAKHCYVVTSELAKRNTKGCGARGLRTAAVTLSVAAALMGGSYGGSVAHAATIDVPSNSQITVSDNQSDNTYYLNGSDIKFSVASSGTVYEVFGSSYDAIGNNLVTINGTVQMGAASGFSYGNGDIKNNRSVVSEGGTVKNALYGAYSSGNGTVSDNQILIDKGTVGSINEDGNFNGTAFGGMSYGNGIVKNNRVTLKEGKVGDIYGGINDGTTSNGSVQNNTVVVDGGVVQYSVYGGKTEGKGDVTDNYVEVNGGTVESHIYCGDANGNGKVSNNKVIIQKESTIGHIYSGFASGDGEVTNNQIEINNSTVTGNIEAGFSAGTGKVSGNMITMKKGISKNVIIGGSSYGSGLVTDNTVKLNESQAFTIHGGIAGSGDVTNNKVEINNSTGNDIYGGSSGSGSTGNVLNNQVYIKSSTIGDGNSGGSVYGGLSYGNGNVLDNTVTLNESSAGEIYGGCSIPINNEGLVKNNSVSIKGGKIDFDVFGGLTKGNGVVSGNTVTVENTDIGYNYTADSFTGRFVYGGFSYGTGAVEENNVEFKGGKTGSVIGGASYNDTVGKSVLQNNGVSVSGGSTLDTVYGGFAYYDSDLINNHVTVSGGTVNNVYGGYANGNGDVINNSVTLSGGTVQNEIIGGYAYGNGTSKGAATGNTVIIKKGTARGVTGGYAFGSGSVTGNNVVLDGGEVENISGGSNDSYSGPTGIIDNNTVIINGGTVRYFVHGGGTNNTSDVKNNQIEINGGEILGEVIGGFKNVYEENTGVIEGNAVIINGGTFNDSIFGGASFGYSIVKNNHVEINGGVINGSVYGGRTNIGNVTDNTVTLNGVSIGVNVYGGYRYDVESDVVTGNTLILSKAENTVGGEVQNFETIKLADTVTWAEGKTVLSANQFTDNADGSKATLDISEATDLSNATSGTMTMLASNTENNLNALTLKYAGGTAALNTDNQLQVIKAGTAKTDKNNGVTISYNTGEHIVYIDGASNYKKVNYSVADVAKAISFSEMEWDKGHAATEYNYSGINSLDVTAFTISKPETIAENTSMTLLQANKTLKDMRTQVKNSYSIEPIAGVTMDAMLSGDISSYGGNVTYTATSNQAGKLTFGNVEWKDSGALLDHKITLSNVSFNGAAVDTTSIGFTNKESLRAGQQMTLVSDFGDRVGTITGSKYKVGTAYEGEGHAELQGNNLIFKTDTGAGDLPVSDETHNTMMAMEAGIGLLATGNGPVGKALEGLSDMANRGEDGASVYASVGGGGDRYETNSHVNSNSWNALVAVGAKKDLGNGGIEYGIFGEYGKSNYTLHSDAGRGDGNAHYAGGGLLAKWVNHDNVYVEGSFRLGRLSDSASDILHDGNGNSYGYNQHANYFGGHIGIGKVFHYKGGKSLDIYGKYFHMKRDGIDFTAKEDVYRLDSVTSSVLRIGARYGSTDKKWNWYGGLAYEYEFDGEATGTVNGTAIRSASIKGSSVRAELGMRMDATKDNPWRTDISIYGYGGKHRGFGGSVNVAYTF